MFVCVRVSSVRQSMRSGHCSAPVTIRPLCRLKLAVAIHELVRDARCLLLILRQHRDLRSEAARAFRGDELLCDDAAQRVARSGSLGLQLLETRVL